MTLISPADLHRIEQRLDCSVTRLLQTQGAAHLHPFVQCLKRYVTSAGKRIRPQLCLWSFASLSDTDFDSNLLDVACSWEIFHAFLLIHDDLIDAADTRRNIPSLHRQLQSLDHDSPQFGQNLAIVAGDLLFGASIRLLAEMELDPVVQVQLIRLFSRIACTTGLGQAIDLFQSQAPLSGVSEELLLCEYDWKTAAYTFEGPLLSGAILAGADAEVQSVISQVSRRIGQAYQLHNDLQDLNQPAHEGCDLVQGKRTISLMRARANMTDQHRRTFDRQLDALPSANGQALKLAELLRAELFNSGAVGQTQCMIARLLTDARTLTEAPTLPPRFAKCLSGLIDGLQQQYFAAAVQSPISG